MLAIFNAPPDWDNYEPLSAYTRDTKAFFDSYGNGGPDLEKMGIY